MKRFTLGSQWLLFAAIAISPGRAATITWTNTSGGNWSVADNWEPNQVPGDGDTALITSNGTYTVTLDVSPTIANFTLGGGSGKQTLTTSGNSLTLTNASTVSTNGIFGLSGGTFSGTGLLTVHGLFNWTDGNIGNLARVTIASNAVMNISGGSGLKQVSGMLTNAGTTTWSGTSDVQVPNDGFSFNGGIINLAGATFDIQNDQTLSQYGVGFFNNAGTVLKSAGSGTNNFGVIFNNTGTVDVHTGTLSLAGGGAGNGAFNAAANATLMVTAGYTVNSGAVIAGAGTHLWTGGVIEVNTTVVAPNVQLAGATLRGTNTFTGMVTWTDGNIGNLARVTIAINAVMNISGGSGLKQVSGMLTNAGTITWSGTNDVQVPNDGFSFNGGIINLAGATFDIQNDQTLSQYGVGFFNNAGMVRKSAGTGTNNVDVIFNNTGTVDVQTGTVSFASGSTFSSGSAFTGAGRSLLGSGSVTLNGAISSANLELGGAMLSGTNTFAGMVTWTDGNIGNLTRVTIATNAVMNISGGSGLKQVSGMLTNAGTITWSGTNDVQVPNDGFSFNGGIINLAGAMFDIQNDQTLSQYGAGFFNNEGMVRKSAGTGTNNVNVIFNNTGTVDVQTGTLNFDGGYDLTGGTLNFGLSGLTNFGRIYLAGAATLTGTVSANLNGGYQPIATNSFAVLSYGSETGIFTNAVLPAAEAWQTNYAATVFTLTVLNARPTIASLTNQVVNELATLTVTNTAADRDVPAQTLTFSFGSAPNGMTITPLSTNAGVIHWTPQQTNSPSTNTVSVIVTDNGTPPLSVTNTFLVVVREVNVAPSLSNVSTQTVNALALLSVSNPATNANIHATNTGYGLVNPPAGASISSSGVITWTPTRPQGPGTNTITTVVTNTDIFDLINPHLTATNSFTVIVYAPTLAQPGNYTVNAGHTVSFAATATDNDPTRTLTFSIVSGPSGTAIGSSTGLFNWRAPAASAGSSNNIQLRVSDNSVPAVTDTKSFYILVNQLGPVTLKALSKTATNFQIQVTGPIGPDYLLQANTAVANSGGWSNLLTNTPVASPFIVTDTNVAGINIRFYRVQLAP